MPGTPIPCLFLSSPVSLMKKRLQECAAYYSYLRRSEGGMIGEKRYICLYTELPHFSLRHSSYGGREE